MKRRLEVLLDADEMERIRKLARCEGMTVSDWVRQALRAKLMESSSLDAPAKLEAVRKAARHSFPTGDVPQMLEEISRGYAG